MIQYIVLTLCLVVACRADTPVVAPPSPPQVYCGETPNEIYGCVGIPRFVSVTITRKCKKNTICEKMTCLFEESGWLDGTKVDKTKLSQHFEQFALEQAPWATAIHRAKEACLVDGLPPQGVQLNCPAYDIMTCTFATMLKNAPPAQWQTTDKCAYAHQYAAACPVCPGECFAAAVPNGSCNACLALPRTP